MPTNVQQQVQEFFAQYPTRNFRKGELLIDAEEAPKGVFYILEGRVSQYDITSTGNEVVVNVFKPGAFFPMSWAMNSTANYYFFEASTDVLVREAPAREAIQFLKDNPEVLFDLLARVYRGVDGVLRRMAHLMGGDARTRLIFELLNAAYRFGELQPDGSVLVTLKESDLAKHSGLARETVSRAMKDLKRANLVHITQDGITVKDTKQLEAAIGSDV